MPPSSAEDVRSDPLRWLEPLAQDMILAAYARIVPDEAARSAITRCHGMLWRGLLSERPEAAAFRRELSRMANAAAVPESSVDAVNRLVLAELLNVVAARHSRSPREAGRLSYQVAIVGCRLAQIRPLTYTGSHPIPEDGTAVLRDAQRGPAPEMALAKRRA